MIEYVLMKLHQYYINKYGRDLRFNEGYKAGVSSVLFPHCGCEVERYDYEILCWYDTDLEELQPCAFHQDWLDYKVEQEYKEWETRK